MRAKGRQTIATRKQWGQPRPGLSQYEADRHELLRREAEVEAEAENSEEPNLQDGQWLLIAGLRKHFV